MLRGREFHSFLSYRIIRDNVYSFSGHTVWSALVRTSPLCGALPRGPVHGRVGILVNPKARRLKTTEATPQGPHGTNTGLRSWQGDNLW